MSIGYACIHIGSEKTKLSTLRLKNATDDNLRRVIAGNLDALQAMIQYNIENGITLFRISSEIIPFGSHPDNQLKWRAEFHKKLCAIGTLIRNGNIRVSMHPGQYTVLNSPHAGVLNRTLLDLAYHCALLDALGCDETCKIILHIGGVYSDKPMAIKRFIENYQKLDEDIKARLAIENDDKAYHIEDVLYISRQTGLPVVYDHLHHELNSPESGLSAYDWIDACAKMWTNKDGRQKIHYSQTDINTARGAHSKHIRANAFMRFYNGLHSKDVDIMLEVKDKNLSAIKCMLLTQSGLKIASLEREWARYKYLVLSRSASVYNAIRELLKDKARPDAVRFYNDIEDALYLAEDKGAEVNAAQHVWGYVSGAAAEKEIRRFHTLLDDYQRGIRSSTAVKTFLYRMAKQQEMNYLLTSLYFYM